MTATLFILAMGAAEPATAGASATKPQATISGCVIKPNTKCPKTDFANAKLSKANLRGADLRGSNFRGAKLDRANLTRADLRDIGAGGTWTVNPLTGNTELKEGPWIRVRAAGANLSGAEFMDGNLSGSTFKNANFSDVFITRTRMAKADLSGANLTRTEIYGSPEDPQAPKQMGRNPFKGLKLVRANLTDAWLSFDLAGVDLRGATLTRAVLFGATNLDKAKTSGATFCGATLPDGYDGPINIAC